MKRYAYYSDYVYYESRLCRNSWLLVADGKVEGLSESEPEGYELRRFSNSAIFPALINTHTHLPMTMFRGIADDLSLNDWLTNHIWPTERKWLSNELVKDAVLLAAADMITSGVSCANDMYFYAGVAIRTLSEIGLRGTIGCGVVMDINATKSAKADEFKKSADSLVEMTKDNPLINISICPHAPYTATPDTYRAVVDYVREKDILLHTHLAETARENDDITARYGKRPIAIMDEVGAFDCKSIFAHCVHLNDDEIALMGAKKVNMSHCAKSNLKLGSGIAPIQKLIKAGANVTIGTDSAASTNDQDMLSEINIASLLQKGITQDATALNAHETLDCATKNAAKALYMDNVGELAKGKEADFFVLSFEALSMQPVFDPIAHLVYCAKKNDITDMYVAGKPLMINRTLTTIDVEAVRYKSKIWRDKLI
ncbi:MAG: amidohydrolase family protein [Deferribacteraceae bacterium]|jgi:5-methylthioadenosine/S-adenosylhomocysteine deaminase|nr:amidohydrolase family protein [Deferribacteraceae bacterium]